MAEAILLTVALAQLLQENELETITVQQYQRAVKRFNEWIGRAAMSADLTVENVNTWIAWMAERGMSPKSIKNHRGGLCRVWNYLTQLGLSSGYVAKRLRQPKVIPKTPEAWALSNITALLKACDEIQGATRAGIPAGVMLRAWILLGYSTGFRPIDLRLLKWSQVDFVGCTVSIIQHKTGHGHVGRFDKSTADALQAIMEPKREVIFPMKSAMTRWEKRLFKLATKHGFQRKRGQALGTLRKSHGTEVCRVHGLNAAAESLGHVSGSSIARLHYVQPDAMRPGMLPPSIQ